MADGEHDYVRHQIRVFVWTEDKTQKSVFTETIQKRRGKARLVMLEHPITIQKLEAAYGDAGPDGHGKAGLKIFLLPEGHPIDHANLNTIREGDKLLLRGGARLAVKTCEKSLNEARKVDIKFKITSLADVNTVNQSFFCDFLLVCTWHEPTLHGIPIGQVDWSLVFDPLIDVRNSFDLEKMSAPFGDDQSTRLEESTGLVTHIIRYKGILAEPMELEVFPFDHQALHIQVCTQGMAEDKVILYSSAGTMSDVFLPDWEIEPQPSVFTLLTEPQDSIHHKRFSELHINVHAKRRESYYIWNIGLIILAIVSLSFTSFAIPEENVEGRLTINLTLLLTAMAFKFVIAASLPVVAYLTPLDKYLLGNFAFLWVMTCYNGVIPYFMKRDYDMGNYDMEVYWFMVTLYSSLQMYTVCWCLRAREKGANFYKDLQEREYGQKAAIQLTPRGVDGEEVNVFDNSSIGPFVELKAAADSNDKKKPLLQEDTQQTPRFDC